MKKSLFTICEKDNDGSLILYNTLTQALAVCPSNIEPSTCENLRVEGFFVDDCTDETSRLIKRYEADCATTENFCLAITPTLDCNFACPYCYEREVRHAGIMSEDVQVATVSFIERNFLRLGSKKVKLVWYGGEPLLGASVIQNISNCLIEDDIPLEASMLSNASLITEEIASMLAQSHVTRVSTTLDGVGRTHDIHRPSRNGAPTYETIICGLQILQKHGIEASVLFNEDRGNTGEYGKLCAELLSLGITNVTASQVFDYCQCINTVPDFSSNDYDLFTDPKEFALKQYRRAVAQGATDELLASFMAPLRLYCSRQVESYFVIDEKGKLYECDGDVGYEHRALGSVYDDVLPAHKPYNPFKDQLCEQCAYIPICLGNCRWTRDCVGESCAPQKAIIHEILHDWRAVLEDALDGEKHVELKDGMQHGGDDNYERNARVLRAGTPPDFDSPTPYVLWL